jgi:hypothetical protein
MKKWLTPLLGLTLVVAVTTGAVFALTGDGPPDQEPGREPPSQVGPLPPIRSDDDIEPSDPVSPLVAVRAPIDQVDVLIKESFPLQYAVRVVSGLPNACVKFGQITWERDGDTIRVEVFNVEPASDEVMCAQVYGTAENIIELGSDFESRKTYTVVVNGVTETFVAR